MANPKDKSALLFSNYIASKKLLIADTSGASRAGLAKTLSEMGAKTANIVMASSYEIAKDEITRIKPQVVICDYNLGSRCGLELLQTQRAQFPAEMKQSIFMLVTGNTSQSAAAQAAEEDVDCYVLKPYTLEVLRQSILKAVLSKIHPSPYMVTIGQGKDALAAQDYDGAIKLFEAAAKQDPKPSLACFYRGQAQMIKEAMEVAQGSFQKGLEYNKIHYKCLVGLYDILLGKKKYSEAYDLVKRISRYFPANPQRLTQVLRLAITTQSYDDIEKFYQIFTGFDQRDEELIKYVCAALVVTGKFYLQKSLMSRAFELFQKAATTAQGRTRILREIITSLMQFNIEKEATQFLARFPGAAQGGEDYLVMDYLIASRKTAPGILITKGRALLEKGVHDPIVYKVIIAASSSAKLNDAASSLLAEAIKRWPKQQPVFEAALKTPEEIVPTL